MSITMFLKNRHKKTLQKKVYELKENASFELAKYKSAKRSYNETSSYISREQHLAELGDLGSLLFLNNYLHDELAKLKAYEEEYSIHYQKYLNLQDQLSDLEEQIRNL